jgi:hypothetical protein
MSLLFGQKDPVSEARTHVLIIGVGGYPYLSGGTKETTQTTDGAQALGQLSSPPASAEAFYNTVLKLERNWITPLGSVEVLVSPAPTGKPVFTGQNVDAATLNNIEDVYGDWKKRCNSNPDNVAIFFFCGHGLDKGEHYLLAEDFGKQPDNPWRGAFAFDMTRRGFFTCVAKTQLFFIDACRQVTPDMLRTDLAVTPIDQPSLLAKDCTYNLTQKAAAANEKAYGKKNEASFYTKALIGALSGNAVNRDTGAWRINTAGLSTKMNAFLQLEAPDQGYPQRCISTTSDVVDIIQFDAAPMLSLQVTCDPDAALALAELSCVELQTNDTQMRPPAATPWNLQIQAGFYKIQASFNGGSPYAHTPVFKPLMPPFVVEKLKCTL